VSAPARADREPPQAGESFLTRLQTLAERHHPQRHPFNALMHAGRLDRDDLRRWVANRYHRQTRLVLEDALIVAKSEDPAFRRSWIGRVLEHDGCGNPREPGALELWQRLAAALGLGEAELASGADLLPEVRAGCAECLEAARGADLMTAVSFSLAEQFASSLMQAQLEAWRQHYSFVGQGALDCFTHAAHRARADTELALAFVQAHATTPELERRCFEAFAARCAASWRLLDAVYLACRRRRVPHVEDGVWLMRLSALVVEDEAGQSSAPGVVMGPERALQLNRTAYDLLELCDGRRPLSSIVAELAQRHAAPPPLVERDVATFVAELERRRILAFR
jgi:pyrroloquinoline-quinone synthase